MKKNILFVIDSLVCAGGEKSLTTLLSLLDYSRYSVDLQLFAYGLPLEEFLPEEVNLLSELRYMKFTGQSMLKSLVYSAGTGSFRMLFSRIRYSVCIRREKYTNRQKARLFWQSASNVIENNPKAYDVAISYAQGVPTFYTAEKIKAKRKIAWVNANYKLDDKEKEFQRKYYDQYDKIVTVSGTAKQFFLESFPNYSGKLEVVHDINNPELILKMAQTGKGYEDNFGGTRILTVGRLDRLKGYDIALDACRKLKEHGVSFKWYVLGKGPLKEEIEKNIRDNDLSGHFILLDVKPNPYPFIANCDIYVQTSRSEGFGLAIAEARILNIPVVTTRFDGVYNQMVEGENGLVVDMNADAVYEGIMRLINDTALREHIIQYLKTGKKGNLEEIDKFYRLIE